MRSAPCLPSRTPCCARRERRTGHGRSQRIVASFGDDPLRVPDNLRFLPGLDLLTPLGEYPAQPQVMITFDAASSDRLGVLAANAARAGELIVVDHHASNTRFGTIHLVDPAAAATAVLACELIDRLGLPLTRPSRDRPVCRAGDRHGLVQARVNDGPRARARGQAARDRHQAARWSRVSCGTARPSAICGSCPAALGRAVLEPRQAGGRGLVWTTVSRADRAAYGLGVRHGRADDRRDPQDRRRPRSPSSSSRTTMTPGRCRPGPRGMWTSGGCASNSAAAVTRRRQDSPRLGRWRMPSSGCVSCYVLIRGDAEPTGRCPPARSARNPRADGGAAAPGGQ